eukprot:285940-Pleurochrysis_carterae.AAC.3
MKETQCSGAAGGAAGRLTLCFGAELGRGGRAAAVGVPRVGVLAARCADTLSLAKLRAGMGTSSVSSSAARDTRARHARARRDSQPSRASHVLSSRLPPHHAIRAHGVRAADAPRAHTSRARTSHAPAGGVCA